MSNTPKDTAIISRKINNKTTVHVRALSEHGILETSLYAINWFNLKSKWLYNLYNRLVAPLLIGVGGRLLFKGQKLYRIEGQDIDEREMLLIVRYPSAHAFLDLVANKFFQLASLLRNASVKDFNIGFTRKLAQSQYLSTHFANKLYLVHHFKGAIIPQELSERMEVIGQNCQAHLHYAGGLVARIEIETGNTVKQAPFLMEGIIVFGFNAPNDMQELLDSTIYTQLREELTDNYLSVFQRIA